MPRCVVGPGHASRLRRGQQHLPQSRAQEQQADASPSLRARSCRRRSHRKHAWNIRSLPARWQGLAGKGAPLRKNVSARPKQGNVVLSLAFGGNASPNECPARNIMANRATPRVRTTHAAASTSSEHNGDFGTA